MARYKRYDYKQSVLIPVRLDEQLMVGTLEHAIHTLVETRMDLSVFEQRYNNDQSEPDHVRIVWGLTATFIWFLVHSWACFFVDIIKLM